MADFVQHLYLQQSDLTGLKRGLSSNNSLTGRNTENGPRFFINHSVLLLEMDAQLGPGDGHEDPEMLKVFFLLLKTLKYI